MELKCFQNPLTHVGANYKNIKIKYKYFPEHKIDGFVAYKNGKKVYRGPADDCWLWFKDTFKNVRKLR